MNMCLLRVRALVDRLVRDRKGAISMMYVLAAVPMVMGVGAAVDYARIEQFKTQLQSITDQAALAGAEVYFDKASGETPAAKATAFFTSGLTSLPSYNGTITPNVTTGTITVNGQKGYSVTVQATGSLGTTFMQLFESSAPISATSVAALMPINVDFYLMLDDSPSMAIAASPSDITTLVNATPQQGGCAFACHEQNPSADNLGNPNGEDNYALARNLGVTLRMDLVQQATSNLISTAQSVATTTKAKFRFAIYTFDYGFNTLTTLTSGWAKIKNAANNIQVQEVYQQSYLTQTQNNNDEDSNFDQAFTSINNIMAVPGHGTNSPGDKPSELLFIVTDGVVDSSDANGNRVISMLNTADCTTIKNRGIQIAIIYTTYEPLPTNSFYNNYVAPFQSNIASDLQACASPNLFTQVDSGGDISGAMTALFNKAISPVAFLVN